MTDDAPQTHTPSDVAEATEREIPRQEIGANDGVPADLETADEGESPAKPRKRRLRRALIATASVIVVLALVVAGAGVWEVHRAFPQYDGVLHLKGLTAPVTVYRDDHAIPQLYAKTADDLFKAQGYVSAQERFWEMDFRRHVTSGRLSEMFGKDQLDTDVYLRTLGWRRVAEQEWTIISPQTRQYLEDYADGVNAYLAGNHRVRSAWSTPSWACRTVPTRSPSGTQSIHWPGSKRWHGTFEATWTTRSPAPPSSRAG